MHFHVVTLFPGAFDSYLSESILKRAIEDKKLKVSFYNPRDFADNEYARIDKPPYGGGPGMVIQALPVIKAIDFALKKIKNKESRINKNLKELKTKNLKLRTKIIFLSPGGIQFTNEYARKTSKSFSEIIIVSGRYEGIDARVKKAFKTEDVSIGPFVLTGGELPAMMMIDSIARQRKGILGNFDSIEERRVAFHDSYTRPEIIEYKGKKLSVPKILLSGDPKKIEEWKESVLKQNA
jgi:tRNA (guanine37-N1)-methyltransferase